MVYLRKTKSKMMSKKVFKCSIYISLVLLIITLSLQTFATASPDVTLGSGVTLTANTVIKLTGLNCDLTLADDHIVDKVRVRSTHVLIDASLTSPTHILNLPYSYSSGVINITGRTDVLIDLYVNISDLAGTKIYNVSESSYLTYVDWSDVDQNLTLTVEASSGTNSTIKVYWPYSDPDVSCTGGSSCIWEFDSVNEIVTLNTTHTSSVTWKLHAETLATTTTTVPTTTTTIQPTEECGWDCEDWVGYIDDTDWEEKESSSSSSYEESVPGTEKTFWFRKYITVPDSVNGVYLNLTYSDNINIYINGDTDPIPDPPASLYDYNITDYIAIGKTNLITVKVWAFGGGTAKFGGDIRYE